MKRRKRGSVISSQRSVTPAMLPYVTDHHSPMTDVKGQMNCSLVFRLYDIAYQFSYLLKLTRM